MHTQLKNTLRNLWKNKTASFLNVFGLAIGIACAALIFLWVEDELSFDQQYPKKDRIYAIRITKRFGDNVFTMGSTPRPLADAIKLEIPGIASATRVSDEPQKSLFSFGEKAIYAFGLYADKSIFDIFSLQFLQGNSENAFKELYSVVLTEKTAANFFGTTENVLGKTVRLDNKQDYTVTGILKDQPQNTTLKFEWLAPYAINLLTHDAVVWGSYGPFTYVELTDKADPAKINQQLKTFIEGKDSKEISQALLFPMNDWHLYDEFANGKQTGGGKISEVRLLSIIAWIILFIACINFINLTTASSQKRAKEVGVRKILGAGKAKLVFQFFSEAFLLALIAAIVAVGMIAIALPSYNMFMEKQIRLEPGNPVHIFALFLITLICSLLAGIYPSIHLASFNSIAALKGAKLKSGTSARVRQGLVVLQFTVSVIFIISTIIVYQQIQHGKNRLLGFKKERLIEIDMRRDISGDFNSLKHELLQTGVVQQAAYADHPTLVGGNTDSRFLWQGKDPSLEISIAFRTVSTDYISTSGMQILDGRDFHADGTSDAASIIISASFAKIIGGESAIGKIIQSPRGLDEGYKNLTIVGVVNDYVFGNVYGSSMPVIFFCNPEARADMIYVRTKNNTSLGSSLQKIAGVMKKNNPAFPFEFSFIDDQFNKLFRNQEKVSRISGLFGILAIMISCLGLFGLAAYSTAYRVKEVGIRKVLGAGASRITAMLASDFMKLVGIACVIAFPVAWLIMNKWLQGFTYRIDISWWIFLLAAATAIVIAMCTISVLVLRAALRNPVESLRTE